MTSLLQPLNETPNAEEILAVASGMEGLELSIKFLYCALFFFSVLLPLFESHPIIRCLPAVNIVVGGYVCFLWESLGVRKCVIYITA